MTRFRLSLTIIVALATTSCTAEHAAPKAKLGPGAFRLVELGTTEESVRYLAAAGEAPSTCEFELTIESAKPASGTPFSFAKAELVRRPGADCASFLQGVATQLAFEGQLPRPDPVDRLSAAIVILGTNQSRSADDGEIAGSFSSTPPGPWTASKLFLADGEAEVFLNLDARDGIGEFSIKDEEYAEAVVTELARILLPRAD